MTVNGTSLRDATAWFDVVLAGPLVPAICSIAIAVMGLAMFAGRFNVRRGATVILGCFVVLGASSIAIGLVGRQPASTAAADASIANPPQPQMPQRNDRKVDDPYAGASLAH